MGRQKLLRDVFWLVLWAALAGTFGCLRLLGHDLWTMPGGQGLSSFLAIASVILAGYRLGVLAIRSVVKVQRGAPGEVDMLAGVLRVVAGIGVGAAVLALFGQLEKVGAALGAFSFQGFQRSARVDFAIPYIYSFRKGVQASARYEEADVQRPTVDVPLSQIVVNERDRSGSVGNEREIGELAARIQTEGLIQPVVLDRSGNGQYQVAAGHMRVEACKRLGWRSLPAIIREEDARLSIVEESERDQVSEKGEGANYAHQSYSTDQADWVGLAE